MPKVVIDGKEVFAKTSQTIIEVCKEASIYIPTLCPDGQLKPLGSCQICIAELQGYGIVASYAKRIVDGMVIQTNNAKVASARKQYLESLLLEH